MTKENSWSVFACIAVVIFAAESSEAAIRRVRAAAPGPVHDGTTWDQAYTTLQAALLDPQATEIWVARGVYKPTNQTTPIALRSGVPVYGGYKGTNPNADSRNLDAATNGTILSGDIGQEGVTSDNAFRVVKGDSLSTATVLESFTITGGNSPTNLTDNGACIFLTSASPIISRCRLVGNLGGNSVSGGAIYWSNGSNPLIQNCTFLNNTAGTGGAIRCDSGTSALGCRIENCVFQGNLQTNAGSLGGGALWVGGSAGPSVTGCSFVENVSLGSYGGGGIVNASGASWNIQRCSFIANEARSVVTSSGGGAVATLLGTLTVRDCLFARNTAFRNGGGVHCRTAATIAMYNCTLYGNSALLGAVDTQNPCASTGVGGGLRVECGTTATVGNGIFWANTGNDSDALTKQISNAGSANVTYCDIEGCSNCFNDNNLGTDPDFVDKNGGNYRIRQSSQCHNSGNNGTVIGGELDLDGRSRRADDNHDGTLENVDRGAYEWYSYLDIDCNHNTIQDWEEIHNGWELDCNGNGIPDRCEVPWLGTGADCNHNYVPDACDIASGFSLDCNHDGIPDECVAPDGFVDCNHNCIPDACDINCNAPGCSAYAGQCGTSQDTNPQNGKPDECDTIGSRVWTTYGNFNQGTRINLTENGAGEDPDALKRLDVAKTRPLPYIWVAASGRNTVVRIDTETGTVLGEYRSAPKFHGGSFTEVVSNPSRTTVDLDGSVWLTNRGDDSVPPNPRGSVVKIGLVVGGTRVNADGTANATGGKYLKGPFDYCTCEDRNGDGLIRTSMGLGEILAWDNWDAADDNLDSDNAAVRRAEDECIIRYTRVDATGTRTIAVAKDNNIWVGGTGNFKHEKVDGFTGLIASSPFAYSPYGGYGGLVDCRGYLWSASGGNKLLRVNTESTTEWRTFDTIAPGQGFWSYGLGLDTSVNVWVTTFNGGQVYQIDSKTEPPTILATPATGGANTEDRGVAVTPANNDVWIAKSVSAQVLRMDSTNFTSLTNYAMGANAFPTGVAVDQAGKVWVTNRDANNVVRINPSLPPGSNPELTVDLNYTGQSLAPAPYNYGDMTGMVGLMATAEGTWSVVYDGVKAGKNWSRITWNRESGCTADTRLSVQVRANDNRAALPKKGYSSVTNSDNPLQILTDTTGQPVSGRFIEIRVRFQGSCPGSTYDSPTLCDLTVYPVECCKGDLNGINGSHPDGVVNGGDVQNFINILLGYNPGNGLTYAENYCRADMKPDGVVNLFDVDCYIAGLLSAGIGCPYAGCLPALGAPFYDCNNNLLDDLYEIAHGNDCNNNGHPDDCDLEVRRWTPFGSTDCNNNLIPDECDIASGYSQDCNGNGIPDECDTASGVDDCNGNHVPDECEVDCNNNDIPDDCDITSQVSLDCNQNGVPDECDIKVGPPNGSFDCNENGIPDECDIASGYAQDCNENGVPDSCDIASGTSPDWDGDGIPDECSIFGDMPMMSGGDDADNNICAPAPEDFDAAWAQVYAWCAEQCWGPGCGTTGAEQYQAYVDKLCELGLIELTE